MRVAMFSDYFPPHLGGGVEKVVLELSRGLAAAGVDLDVYTLRTAGGAEFEEIDGFRVHRAAAFDLTSTLRLQSAVSPSLIAKVACELRANPPDIIHAHSHFFFSSIVAAASARLLGRPLVTTLHLGSLEAMPLAQRLPVLVYERSLGRAIVAASDRVIAVSQAVADYAQRYGAGPEKTMVQPNAVDCKVYYPAKTRGRRPVRFAFVGRLIQNKGPQYLIEAVPQLLAIAPEAEIWFVGDGPLRVWLENRAGELGLTGRVSFFGTRADVPELLRQCDVFIRPSLMEGMPLTVLEAMATGLPVIATPVGGTAEIVEHEVTGLLVDPGEVDQLGQAMQRLLNTRLRNRLGEEARRRVEADFGWPRIVQDTLALYEDLAATAGSSHKAA